MTESQNHSDTGGTVRYYDVVARLKSGTFGGGYLTVPDVAAVHDPEMAEVTL